MAGKKTGAAAKKKEDQGREEWVIRNGRYPQFLTGIVRNDKDGVIYSYATEDIHKAMRFTEAEAREVAEKCHGRLMVLARPWEIVK